MKQLKLLALAVLAVPAIVYAADTAPSVPAPKETCSNIEWNPAFLKDYPTAPGACRSIAMKDGRKYATFDGKVVKVGPQFVQVEVSDVSDNPLSMIAFQIGAGGRITIGDKVEKVKDLKVGDHLTFWVREGDFGVSPTLVDRPMPIIRPVAASTN